MLCVNTFINFLSSVSFHIVLPVAWFYKDGADAQWADVVLVCFTRCPIEEPVHILPYAACVYVT